MITRPLNDLEVQGWYTAHVQHHLVTGALPVPMLTSCECYVGKAYRMQWFPEAVAEFDKRQRSLFPDAKKPGKKKVSGKRK